MYLVSLGPASPYPRLDLVKTLHETGFYQQTRFLDLGASASRTDWRGLSWPPFHSKVKQVTES